MATKNIALFFLLSLKPSTFRYLPGSARGGAPALPRAPGWTPAALVDICITPRNLAVMLVAMRDRRLPPTSTAGRPERAGPRAPESTGPGLGRLAGWVGTALVVYLRTGMPSPGGCRTKQCKINVRGENQLNGFSSTVHRRR